MPYVDAFVNVVIIVTSLWTETRNVLHGRKTTKIRLGRERPKRGHYEKSGPQIGQSRGEIPLSAIRTPGCKLAATDQLWDPG
jgi:hypothetical protein